MTEDEFRNKDARRMMAEATLCAAGGAPQGHRVAYSMAGRGGMWLVGRLDNNGILSITEDHRYASYDAAVAVAHKRATDLNIPGVQFIVFEGTVAVGIPKVAPEVVHISELPVPEACE